jgi:ribose-phosphate pyrophosphokinase
VHACCTHGVLSGPAIDRLENSKIKTLVVTNSVPLHERARQCDRIKVLSISNLLAEAIRSIHSESSVSSLFV